jgi:glutamate/tyrosine decarboxylase-like PLP-dependent enzyme
VTGGAPPADDRDRIAAKIDAITQAVEAATAYVAGERYAPVTPINARPVEPGPIATGSLDTGPIDAVLDRFDLDHPADTADVIATLAELGEAYAVRSTGGRYFGFVTGGTEPTSLAASLLATVWDQNAALRSMSPLANAIDSRAATLLIELLNLPPAATAAFCGGASVANLTAVVTARDALLRAVGWDIGARGLNGAPPIDVVISDEAHVSVDKALRLAGFGTDAVVRAPVDDLGRIDAERFPPTDRATLVVAQAGNVNTGHSDPFAAIADRLPAGRRLGVAGADSVVDRAEPTEAPVWIHIDGAFGLWAAASSVHAEQLAGVERADSWATDCHKWLNVPYDCGVVAVADGTHLVRAMTAEADYLDGSGSVRSPMHLGLQMSQAARAIPVWAALAALGRQGVAELVERSCRLAQRIAAHLTRDGAELLVPVALNQVLVRFDDDATTEAVIAAVPRSGECWMGGTTWHGRKAMRISVSDIATTEADIDRAAAAVLAAWAGVDR